MAKKKKIYKAKENSGLVSDDDTFAPGMLKSCWVLSTRKGEVLILSLGELFLI